MYTDYFQLAELPFRITPDPRFLWYSDQHLEAKQKILYHLKHSAGPIYLLADIGTGKTSIARRIMEELSNDPSCEVVFVFSPKLTTTNAFLRFVMDEFNVKTHHSYGKSLRNFENFLIEQHRVGKSPILLIDEAQNMTRDMLLLIQHLFNFSTNTDFLIQIALFAQPELQAKLERLQSLKSRMNVSFLKPFDFQQTQEMLKFRWKVAGGEQIPFDTEATQEIFRLTGGVPRAIVKLANEALIRTAVENRQVVTQSILQSSVGNISVGDL